MWWPIKLWGPCATARLAAWTMFEDQDLTSKDQDQDLTSKDQDQDLISKDQNQDQDQDLKIGPEESLKTKANPQGLDQACIFCKHRISK